MASRIAHYAIAGFVLNIMLMLYIGLGTAENKGIDITDSAMTNGIS